MVPAALHGERGGDDRHVAPGRRRASIVAGRGSRPGRRRCFASEKVRKLQLLLTTTRARGKADRVVLARRTNRARRALVSHDPDHGARNTAVAPSQSAMVTTRSLPMPGCLLAAGLASLPRVAPAQRAGRRHLRHGLARCRRARFGCRRADRDELRPRARAVGGAAGALRRHGAGDARDVLDRPSGGGPPARPRRPRTLGRCPDPPRLRRAGAGGSPAARPDAPHRLGGRSRLVPAHRFRPLGRQARLRASPSPEDAHTPSFQGVSQRVVAPPAPPLPHRRPRRSRLLAQGARQSLRVGPVVVEHEANPVERRQLRRPLHHRSHGHPGGLPKRVAESTGADGGKATGVSPCSSARVNASRSQERRSSTAGSSRP